MARIRFASPKMATFSSFFGRVKFQDGVSVSDVNDSELRILSSTTRMEIELEDGSWGPVGVTTDLANSRGQKAPIVSTLKREQEPVEPVAEITPAPQDIPAVNPVQGDDLSDIENTITQPAENETPATPPASYDREALEKIADEDGIRGLRAIATPLGVKDNSIAGLITEILKKQGK